MLAPTVDILMYHSISRASGPTSISPEVFARQIAQLVVSNLPVLRMDEVAAHLAQGHGRAVAITFDDGLEDFRQNAWPILRPHGFRPMVYLPTECIGGNEIWAGAHVPPRPLMSWDGARELAAEGVDFGNHSACHDDLSCLDPRAAAEDIDRACARFAAELGQPPAHFAPPYGHSTPAVRCLIGERHRTSVGTVLATADARSDPFDLPRIEMHYFRAPDRWDRHLSGDGVLYLTLRRKLRAVRRAVWSRGNLKRARSWSGCTLAHCPAFGTISACHRTRCLVRQLLPLNWSAVPLTSRVLRGMPGGGRSICGVSAASPSQRRWSHIGR